MADSIIVVETMNDVIVIGQSDTNIANHEAAANPHPGYLMPNEVVAGANITVDTTTVPGSVIIAGQAGGGGTGGVIDHEAAADPHPVYLMPSDVVAGANITIDTTTTPGAVIISGQAGGGSDGGAPPLEPTNFQLIERQGTYVGVSWENPSFDLDGLIMRRIVGSVPVTAANAGVDVPIVGTPTTATVSGLTTNTTYSLTLWSRDADNNLCTNPATLTFSTRLQNDTVAPGQITGLQTQESFVQVVYTWTNPIDADYSRLIIRRLAGSTAPATINDGEQVYDGVPITNIVDTGLLENTNYSYSFFTADDVPNVSSPVSTTILTLGAPKEGNLIMTTNGATFNPQIRFWDGESTTLTWYDESNTVIGNGTEPTITFGSVADRQIRMHAVDVNAIHTINFGFNYGDDAGRYNLGIGYNWPSQDLSTISGIQEFSRLVNFCAARPTTSGGITSILDFTGLAYLEFVECFRAPVAGMIANGNTNLIRLCYEEGATGSLNLNQVAGSIRDLRAAVQRTGSLTLVPQTEPLVHMYHFCVRDQPVINLPPSNLFPALEEYWAWNTNQSGHLIMPPNVNSAMLGWNHWTSVDLSLTNGVGGLLNLYGSQLETITGLDTGRQWDTIILSGCGLTTQQLDYICNTVAAWGTSNGTLNLGDDFTGTNDVVSTNSQVARNALRARNWTLTLNYPADVTAPNPHTNLQAGTPTGTTVPLTWTLSTSPDFARTIVRYTEGTTPPPTITSGDGWSMLPTDVSSTTVQALSPSTTYAFSVFALDDRNNVSAPVSTTATTGEPPIGETYLLWRDTFDRANGSPGNGWVVTDASREFVIDNNQLSEGGALFQFRWIHNLMSTAQPLSGDLAVEIVLRNTTNMGAMGIFARFNPADRTGVKCLIYSTLEAYIGNSSGFYTDNAGLPAGGALQNPIPNWGGQNVTLRLELRGSNVIFMINGVVVKTRSNYTVNENISDGAIGICGYNPLPVDVIRVYKLAPTRELLTTNVPDLTATAEVSTFYQNVARLATPSSSSSRVGRGPENAINGVISGTPYDSQQEWALYSTTGWIQLDWSNPVHIDRVMLFDRPNTTDNITSGTLTFSDGDSVSVGPLPSGWSPESPEGLDVPISPRDVTWIRFTVDSTSTDTVSAGLSEFKVFGRMV